MWWLCWQSPPWPGAEKVGLGAWEQGGCGGGRLGLKRPDKLMNRFIIHQLPAPKCVIHHVWQTTNWDEPPFLWFVPISNQNQSTLDISLLISWVGNSCPTFHPLLNSAISAKQTNALLCRVVLSCFLNHNFPSPFEWWDLFAFYNNTWPISIKLSARI